MIYYGRWGSTSTTVLPSGVSKATNLTKSIPLQASFESRMYFLLDWLPSESLTTQSTFFPPTIYDGVEQELGSYFFQEYLRESEHNEFGLPISRSNSLTAF